jgi:hypothetical protein
MNILFDWLSYQSNSFKRATNHLRQLRLGTTQPYAIYFILLKNKPLKIYKLLSVLLLVIFVACNNDDDNNFNGCDDRVIISSREFTNAPSDQLTISNLEITNNCLSVSFSASGCSGESWRIKLIDAAEVLESDPPQRNLRLSLDNNELCDAIIARTVSFDLTRLQLEGNEIILRIANNSSQIMYRY